MARRAAAELQAGEIANLGFGVSALVPHILVEEGLASAVSWVIEQGAVGGVPLRDFAFGAAQNPDAIMQSVDQFTLLQGGGFAHALLSFLEIDQRGDVNVHSLPKRRHVTAGIGGFVDIISAAPAIVFVGSFTAGRRDITVDNGALHIRADGPHTKFVKEVDSPTFSGQRALANGQKVLYVTERAVIELRPEGLTVVEIAPGVDLKRDVLDRCEFTLRVSPDLSHHVAAAVRSSTRRTHADSHAGASADLRTVPMTALIPKQEGPMTLSDSTLTDTGRITLGWNPTHTVATVLLDRPTKLNALTPEMLDELFDCLRTVHDSEARVMVLRGAGDKAFCVGADIHRFAPLTAVQMWRDWTATGHRVFDALAGLRQPTVAVLHGAAYGGGFELALACDFRVAATDARLGLPEVGLGTVPGWGGTERLTELVGRSRAKEVVLSRRTLDGELAHSWGVANRIRAEG